MSKALLIIDMQTMPFVWKDYGGKALYKEEKLITNTKHLIEKARKSGAPVCYIMFTEPEGSPRAENQPLWKVHEHISPLPQDLIIIKHYADSFLKSGLHDRLQAHGVDTLVMCGLQTEFCVDATVTSGYSHGYQVELVKDCHSTYDADGLTAEQIIDHHNRILIQFADVIPSDQVEFQ
ncbi:cysteine hydrolase [Paenibacillus sp. PR3]|uniref:Cysteine hydrolase n=1 Tax=Paenibacillus terricola TaxID=2763503 RepID=A0ABR8N1D8_9BACL|nr:cysteine hydrolase family protein [Paenibacillus terricola]MBD3921998.1 cysteine hydrolase [Paenibacillus terricola]